MKYASINPQNPESLKKKEASILGQRLAALRRKPHTNGSDFWKKVRREQERERKKLGIRFERDGDWRGGAVWAVYRDLPGGERHEGNIFKRGSHWFNNHSDSPHRTRLEAAKELINAL